MMYYIYLSNENWKNGILMEYFMMYGQCEEM